MRCAIRWSALRLVLVGVFTASATGPTTAQQRTKSDEMDIASLPREVRDALERAPKVYPEPLQGARWSKAHCTSGSEHPVYQVQGTNGDGRKIELEVTSAGRIIEVEEHGIPMTRVPTVVQDALKAKFPRFEPKHIEAIYQLEKLVPVCYGFEGNDANGRKIEVYISADGKSFLN
jgi:hypothetical protein